MLTPVSPGVLAIALTKQSYTKCRGDRMMKPGFLALVTLVATTSLVTPANAQRASVPRIPIIRTASQDFFQQGREQFEREILFLTVRTNLPHQDLLKIRQFPPLEDGPFSFERSNAFLNQIASEDKIPQD